MIFEFRTFYKFVKWIQRYLRNIVYFADIYAHTMCLLILDVSRIYMQERNKGKQSGKRKNNSKKIDHVDYYLFT